MPKQSFDDFAQVIAHYQAPPTPALVRDLVTSAMDIDANDVDEHVTDFTRSRIDLAFRTGDIETHLHHLYDVLTVLERELAKT